MVRLIGTLYCVFYAVSSCALGKQGSHAYMQTKRNENVGEHTFLLSYPRSGNTWMRFCLEALTHRPTLSYHVSPKTIHPFSVPLGLTSHLGTDISAIPLWKAHSRIKMEEISRLRPDRDLLIFIVRDYKKCLLSDLGGVEAVTRALSKPDFLYFDNFDIYEKWDPKKRLLIYYEDFMAHPRVTLEKILCFLHESQDRLAEFFNHFDEYSKQSLELYDTRVRSDLSKQARAIVLSAAEKQALDDIVEQSYPELWKRYLSGYRENTLEVD